MSTSVAMMKKVEECFERPLVWYQARSALVGTVSSAYTIESGGVVCRPLAMNPFSMLSSLAIGSFEKPWETDSIKFLLIPLAALRELVAAGGGPKNRMQIKILGQLPMPSHQFYDTVHWTVRRKLQDEGLIWIDSNQIVHDASQLPIPVSIKDELGRMITSLRYADIK